jgi:hypothetical protein
MGEYPPRYRKAGKTAILNEYSALSGGNRNYPAYSLNREGEKHLTLIDGG